MRSLLVRPLLCAALVGCSGEPSAPSRLTPAEVQGTYLICTLRFTPVQTALPVADVLANVMVADPGPDLPAPAITLSGSAAGFELDFVRRRDAAVQRLPGDVEFGDGSVFLYPDSRIASVIPLETLLPPGHLDLVFHRESRRLTAGLEVSQYSVRRQDYAAAAGFPAEGLQERIYGHVSALLSASDCG